jgi:hypothetical protein
MTGHYVNFLSKTLTEFIKYKNTKLLEKNSCLNFKQVLDALFTTVGRVYSDCWVRPSLRWKQLENSRSDFHKTCQHIQIFVKILKQAL